MRHWEEVKQLKELLSRVTKDNYAIGPLPNGQWRSLLKLSLLGLFVDVAVAFILRIQEQGKSVTLFVCE